MNKKNTGLKDKNGKEIYEGDIIKGLTAGGKEIKEHILYFKDDWFAGKYESGNNYHLYSLSSLSDIEVVCPHNTKHTEITANEIYTGSMDLDDRTLGTVELKRFIITYCADCGEKLKEVIIK